jgi:putative protease
MDRIELLAPAGSFEKAKIAFMYGADAVYMGTPKLSLRSRSEASDSDLVKTIEYAHAKRQTCACSNEYICLG